VCIMTSLIMTLVSDVAASSAANEGDLQFSIPRINARPGKCRCPSTPLLSTFQLISLSILLVHRQAHLVTRYGIDLLQHSGGSRGCVTPDNSVRNVLKIRNPKIIWKETASLIRCIASRNLIPSSKVAPYCGELIRHLIRRFFDLPDPPPQTTS